MIFLCICMDFVDWMNVKDEDDFDGEDEVDEIKTVFNGGLSKKVHHDKGD